MDTLFLACLVVLGIWAIQRNVSQAERTAARVERKLDLVMEHLDLHEEIPDRDVIVALVREGRTVQAVKAYREATGAGLLEAKQAVDRLG
ncbi:hypothetical protein [Streptomyces prasinopilosus]|uniref:Ribosomal protein L7/L12 C-terminal domain-containing protein n=1 Tax=Streptomyces prasinopilosus TaxID=67344 RepID=A0A1G6Z5U9_9ACTN|nr:hypothetical protein [Streptomyces prasinopilosus]SDD97337.1 Ribosomal protein L7/L12 C-terminal domain-containing protein [Streptomyces prasinopilosus]